MWPFAIQNWWKMHYILIVFEGIPDNSEIPFIVRECWSAKIAGC
jgi:hypothetical protein